jgi:radical SAM protein with 4Fe4S-binding SPASM domain
MIELLRGQGYVPRFCVWELTLACNLRCLHCGSSAGIRRSDELSHEECCRVADELAAAGCERITLGGGEPTMHAHWDELGARLTRHGVRVNLLSNGWHFTAEHLERASVAELVNVSFSLDGLESAHDEVRRQGSFGRVVGAVTRCVDAGMPVSIVTHINRLNYLELDELRRFLEGLGVAAWQLQLGTPAGNMGEHSARLVIPPVDLLWLLPQIAEMRTNRPEGPAKMELCPSDNVGYFGRCERALRDRGSRIPFWIGCRAGCEVIGIESNGNVKGCLSLPSARHGRDQLQSGGAGGGTGPFVEGNLRHASLAGLWARARGFAYNRDFSEAQLAGFCAVCRYNDICRGGCAWTAFSHTESRYDNPYCFYRQAVLHRRFDLLGDDDQPSDAELAFGGTK